MAGLKGVIVYNGYPLSVFVALSLHSLVLAALLYFQMERQEQVRDIVITPMVKALLVQENPQLRNEQLLEQQRLIRVEDQRRAREAEQERASEQQRQQELAAAQEREAQQQREREATAQRERQQQEVERQRQQELAAQQERQREQELEQQRQRELAAEQERQRQRDAEAQAASADVAQTENELVMAYTSVIHDLVQQNWSRPPSARNGMEVVIRLRMVPTGDVLDVEIVRSSGDAAFDRAAETAIYRVGQFRELQGMPINLFNT
ncbi:MAG: cell envelope integrity protein TolA, partial [Pseudohongiellaceae bacterium]